MPIWHTVQGLPGLRVFPPSGRNGLMVRSRGGGGMLKELERTKVKRLRLFIEVLCNRSHILPILTPLMTNALIINRFNS